MLKRFFDPQFGGLTPTTSNHVVLDQPLSIPALNSTVQVTFVFVEDLGGRSALTDFHRSQYAQYAERIKQLMLPIDASLANYYRQWRSDWGAEVCSFRGDAHFKRVLPLLGSDSEIWRLVTPFSIELYEGPRLHPFDSRLNLMCSWDEDHGVAIKFKDWRILQVVDGSTF